MNHQHPSDVPLPRASACLLVWLALGVSASAGERSPEAAEPPVPEWRGEVPGTAYLGPDILWRSREGLVFHMQDDKGTGFFLAVTVRDMNTYQQGPRPALLWVTGPRGNTVARELLEDDGVVEGDWTRCDGISDVYQDFRYREWHRAHSPRGYPPAKERSPFLARPEQITARTVHLRIPPVGPGLYRLLIVASWDHWFSITPSRPVPTGVHPGPGPLYVHGDSLEQAYLYAPRYVRDISISISEEIEPFNWSLVMENLDGNVLGRITPRTFFNFMIAKDVEGDRVYRLRARGRTAGAHLHLGGVPFVICPDAETARRIHGGVEIDDKGRATFHHHQRVMLRWADGLSREDLAVNAQIQDPNTAMKKGRDRLRLGDVPKLLAAQNLDRASPGYGRFGATGDKEPDKQFSFWRQPVDVLAQLADWPHRDNPYYGHPGLVRRLVLARAVTDLLRQGPYFWYGHNEGPTTYSTEVKGLWDVAFRSNWYPMHDASHMHTLGALRTVRRWSIPDAVHAAWEQSLHGWAICRTNMHQGECSNQWAVGIKAMALLWRSTRDYELEQILLRQIKRFTTPAALGRVTPDLTPFSSKSSVGYGVAADAGLIGGGVAADGLGHDSEYCLESTSHMTYAWEIVKDPAIVRWLNEYYVLKTHLTLPKTGAWPRNTFRDTCSPTDANFRTRYYTHKTPLRSMRPLVKYGDIWAGQENHDTPWPCMERDPFVHVIDSRHFFIKTPSYYAIVYGGPAKHEFQSWGRAIVEGNAVRLVGYTGMHYGGLQRKPTKVGGISAVWIPECGPTWLCQNHNVMFSNVVWGRRTTPICKRWEEGHVDPYIVCSGFGHPEFDFDAGERIARRTDTLRYAPLRVRRTTRFGDDRITVRVDVEALDAVDLKELYECIPYYAEHRRIRVFDEALAEAQEFAIPAPLTTPSKWPKKAGASAIDPKLTGENPDLPEVSFKAFDVAAKSGAGAAVIFDKVHTCTQTQPIRYRSVASATGAFNLPLRRRFRRGEKVTLRYVIVPHQRSLSAAQLRRVAREEDL